MLDIGSFTSRDCQGLTRRAFVRAACALPFAAELALKQVNPERLAG